MDKTLAGVIGAVTALATAAPSHATAPAPLTADAVFSVSSYADLLKPIPNALAILKEVSATGAMQNSAAPASEDEPGVLEAQYSYHHHHHHHHHHRFFRRRYYHHHHHHHHHHAYYGERFFGLSSISPEADRD